jgi:hypothetical protein
MPRGKRTIHSSSNATLLCNQASETLTLTLIEPQRQVRTLQKIAQTGSLVILSIHQPSYRIMGLFDHLIILAFGEKVFGGRPLDLNLFFEEFGRPVPRNENSTEHALDLIQELHASQEGIKPLVEFCKAWEAKLEPQTSPDRANAAMSSVLSNAKLLASKGAPPMESSSRKADAATVCTFANPWWAEVAVLVLRSWKNIKRTPELFLMRLDHTPLGVQVSSPPHPHCFCMVGFVTE